MRPSNSLKRVVALVLGCALGLNTAWADLTLGVHPFKPATQLIESFTPLAQYLSRALGQPVSLKISKDYQTHSDLVGTNALDIAYMGPAPYVKLTQEYGPKPLLARQVIRGSPVFHGKIFVAKGSPINSLADLRGKRFVFGDPNSTMSHLVPRYMLWQAGVGVDSLANYTHVKDHVNAVLAVLAGDFDAGAVKEDVYLKMEQRGIRAIATSPPISDHVFVASGKLAAGTVAQLREALTTLATRPDGAEILQAITPGVTALVPASDQDYDGLRTILSKLKELGVDP